MAATKAQISALYVGYFGRAADPDGLSYWLSQTQLSLVEIANSFAVQPEATAKYAFLAAPNLQSIPAIDAFITQIYLNTFERLPDAGGLAFWRTELLNGKPPGRVIVDIESGAQGDDKIVLDRKVDVSTFYAENFLLTGNTPWNVAQDLDLSVLALDGDRAFWLSNTAETVAKARALDLILDSFRETFTLTPGQDDFNGGPVGDEFNAPALQTALLPTQTLNTVDSLDGGGGRNTLSAQLVDPFVVPKLLANIQVVNIDGPGGLVGLFINPVLDVINANDIDTLRFRNPTQNITLNNLQSALNTVAILDDSSNGNVFTINHIGDALDGNDDELEIQLRNDGAGSTLNLNHASGNGYEIDNINSIGPVGNNFTLNASPRELSVDGNASLLIRGTALNLATLEVFDSTELEAPAGVDARFFGGTSAAHVTNIDTGDGDDSLVVVNGSMGRLFINTNGGDDSLDIWQHTGSVDVDMADGDDSSEIDTIGNATVHMGEGNNFAEFGQITGNVVVDAGAGDDSFRFEDIIGAGAGKVTANAGDGDNTMYFHRVDGAIDASAGAGNDFFDFDDVFPALTHTFGAGDRIDGGGGANIVRFEVESNAGNKPLWTGGRIVNIQTAQHIGTFVAGTDLTVDFALLNPADRLTLDRLELQGSYGRDVVITNLNDTDGGIDTVAVQSNIADDLSLERAFVTIPAFNIEMGSAGGSAVTIGDELQAGFGTDLITITSLGIGTNEITDAHSVNGNVVLKGATDIDFGAAGTIGTAFGTIIDNQSVDASAASGNDEIWVGIGNQTIIDGAGNDFIGVFGNGPVGLFTGNGHDLIQLDGGRNEVKFFNAATSALVNSNLANPVIHEVTGFNVGSDPVADLVNMARNAMGGNFDRTDGPDVANGDSASIRDYVAGDFVDLSANAFNLIRFDTAIAGATTVQGLFDLAIGAGDITVAAGANEVLGMAYDVTNQQAVIFGMNVDDGPNNIIQSGDDVDGVAVVGMSYADFLAFNPNNLIFTNA